MALSLKPALLENATDPSKIQKLMKADLKASVGKKNLKFVVAKNCQIGPKAISLFIITPTPNLYETVLKTKYPKAIRAKGTCDILKGDGGKFNVTIRTAVGPIQPQAVALLVKPAVVSDSSIQAVYTPPSAKPEGVPEWAKQEYRRDAKRILMASMTTDGKIGSVYFSDGRIRTTHGAGPEKEGHGGQTTVQFNVDEKAALAVFKKEYPKLYASDDMWDHFDQWLVKKLKNVNVKSAPSWAKVIVTPEKAQSKPSDDVKLFEIFKNINGKVESWHPSRGTAVKFVTDKQTVAVLEAAIKHINQQKLTDPNARNVAFYAFVKSRLPSFVQYMREPKDV
ncbi:MAG: hypothetical protein IT317_20235 [Anaerolineales bacterium]|nr:hypothetical protein [Anaerolineales bacterium]